MGIRATSQALMLMYRQVFGGERMLMPISFWFDFAVLPPPPWPLYGSLGYKLSVGTNTCLL